MRWLWKKISDNFEVGSSPISPVGALVWSTVGVGAIGVLVGSIGVWAGWWG